MVTNTRQYRINLHVVALETLVFLPACAIATRLSVPLLLLAVLILLPQGIIASEFIGGGQRENVHSRTRAVVYNELIVLLFSVAFILWNLCVGQ